MYVAHGRSVLTIGLVALLFLTLLPITSPVSAQSPANTFHNDMYGFTVEWTDDWSVVEIASHNEENDSISLTRGDDIRLSVTAFSGDFTTPKKLTTPLPGEIVLVDNTTANPPQLIIEDGLSDPDEVVALEVFSINDGRVVLLVQLQVPKVLLEPAFAIIAEEFTINGVSPFTGQIPADGQMNGQAVAESTEETTTEVVRRPRSSGSGRMLEAIQVDRAHTNTAGKTPAVTESAVNRTSRGQGGAETPEATEVAEAPSAGPVVPDGWKTFDDPASGITISYDPTVWQPEPVYFNGVFMTKVNASLSLKRWDAPGVDAVGCLDEHAEFYGQGNNAIENWEQVTFRNGAPLLFESEGLAWSVYNYTYTNVNGNSYPMVDYISCEQIPGQDAILVVEFSSHPQVYESEFELMLDVLDTLELSEPVAD